MIDGLVLGKLHAKPVARTSRNGNAFVTVALLVAMPDGATLYVSGCAFDGEARRALLALDKGDSVALTDPLAIGLFQPDDAAPPERERYDTGGAVAFDVQRRRKATRAARAPGLSEGKSVPTRNSFADDET
jgi:hypothetical protein